MQTEEGRVLAHLDEAGNFENYEYQYHLKDHLGNTRLTFTTVEENIVFEATMESEYAAIEEMMFTNLPETRHLDLNGNNTVDASITANESASLNGTDPNRRIGPAIVLPVSPGDIINMEVFAAYSENPASTTTIDVALLTSAVATAFGRAIGNTEQGQLIYGTLEEIIAATAGYGSGDDLNAPKAYLQYILFDKNFMPIPVEEGMFGYRSISEAA